MSEFLIFLNGLLFASGVCLLAVIFYFSKELRKTNKSLSVELQDLLKGINDSHNQLSLNQVQFDQQLAETRQTLAGIEHRFAVPKAQGFSSKRGG